MEIEIKLSDRIEGTINEGDSLNITGIPYVDSTNFKVVSAIEKRGVLKLSLEAV